MRGPLPLAQNAPLKLLDASVEKGRPRGNTAGAQTDSGSASFPVVVCPERGTKGGPASGEYRARTGDLLLAKQALSRLS